MQYLCVRNNSNRVRGNSSHTQEAVSSICVPYSCVKEQKFMCERKKELSLCASLCACQSVTCTGGKRCAVLYITHVCDTHMYTGSPAVCHMYVCEPVGPFARANLSRAQERNGLMRCAFATSQTYIVNSNINNDN